MPETLEAAHALILEMRKEIDDLENEADDHECLCEHNDLVEPTTAVGEWLQRQATLGLINAVERAAVERLLGDLS